MKKLILTLLSLCLFALSYSQNIPNGDFEQWEVREHQTLDDWYSYTSTVERTTDSKSGKYAIKLRNIYSKTSNGSKGYVSNHVYNNEAEYDGFAMSGDPLSVVFWSKHDLALGDTARLYMVFRDKGAYKGKIDFRMTGSTNDKFVKYNVPISWNSARTPDSAWIYIYSKVRSKIAGDGYIIFDDIHFEKIGERMPDFTNHDFENYHNIGVHFPSGWRSIDLRTYDNYGTFYTKRSVFKSSESEVFQGKHSIKIGNYMSGSNIRTGYCFFGTEDNDYYTPAFAFKDTFKYLQGYYRYEADAQDTGRINVRTYAAGNSRSNNNFYFPPTEEWTFFSVPLTYNDNRTPDSAAVIAYSTFKNSDRGEKTALYLDNLSMVLEPTPFNLSVTEKHLDANVYPNPCKKTLHINSDYYFDECIAIDALGRSTILKIRGKEIDMSKLQDGLYFISLSNTEGRTLAIKVIKSEAYE
ncbi:MAG: T9SS type A sorting domain-containing protein [Bacteroidia bacterium]